MAIRLSSPFAVLLFKSESLLPTLKISSSMPTYTNFLKFLALLTSLTTLFLSHTIGASLLSESLTRHFTHLYKGYYTKHSHPHLLQIPIYTTLTPLLTTIYLATSLLYNHLVTLTLPPQIHIQPPTPKFKSKPTYNNNTSSLISSPKPSSSHSRNITLVTLLLANLITLSLWTNCELPSPFPNPNPNTSPSTTNQPEFLFENHKLRFCVNWPLVESNLQWCRFGLGVVNVCLFGALVAGTWWEGRRVRYEIAIGRKEVEEKKGMTWDDCCEKV